MEGLQLAASCPAARWKKLLSPSQRCKPAPGDPSWLWVSPIYDIPHGKQSLQMIRRWRRSRCLTSPRAKGLQSSLSEALFPLEINSSSSYTHGGGLLFPKQDLWVMKGAGEAAGTSPASAGSRQAQHRAHIYKSSGPTWPFSSRI